MLARLQSAWNSNRQWAAGGFLLASTLYLLLGFLNWNAERRGISEQRGTGLAAVAEPSWAPVSLWRQRSIIPSLPHRQPIDRYRAAALGGVVGGVPGGLPASVVAESRALAADSRDIVRTGALHIFTANAAHASEQIQAIASRYSGFVLKSTINGTDQEARSAQIVVRIPSDHFDEARQQIRRLATSVAEDTTEARDVTRDAADQQATLRNYRAEEAQYLAIMKRASSVSDVLEVSEKLADVRGRIDRLEGEIGDLRQQVDMSLLNITITSIAEAQVFGLNWRPLYEAKLSARNALASLADFADSLVALVLHLPVILLWGVLVLVVLKLGWLTLRLLGRALFPALPFWRSKAAETR